MKQFYNRIVNTGIAEGEGFVMRNRLRVFNTAIFVVLLISCFYCFMAFTHDYILSSYATVYSIASCLFILFLVHKRRYNFAFHFGMWYGFVFLSAFTLIFGNATNAHLYFLFLPIACLILFDDKRITTLYFILSLILTLLNFIAMEEIKPYYTVSDEEAWLGYPNIPFVLTLIYLAVRMFKNENRKYAARIEEQKEAIEEKNKEITDSINYARRIQSALLAPAALMKKNLPEHFVLYKPKDIVSGDFYFAAETTAATATATATATDFWLCAGDCTGHGVPGAFMSLLNISILRELITEQKVDQPDLVLNRQRERIIAALNPDGAEEQAKDGMDCVLLKFDFQRKQVQLACANNPVLIVRDKQLTEFKADKQPVGIHEGNSAPFTLHTWDWKTGDRIYLFTDGYADQFGGPKGKKFKYAQLKENILQGEGAAMAEQEKKLNTLFEDWKGKLEQVDDVLIIGIQL